MKYLLFSFSLLLCLNISAKELPKKSQIFVQVYNQQNIKIAKGKILKITDSTLVLKKGSNAITIKAREIDYIKTKRTKGHSVLVGAGPGTVILVGSIAFGEPGWGQVIGAAGGMALAVVGGTAGFVASLFKKSTKYSFTGDSVKWKVFKEDFYGSQTY